MLDYDLAMPSASPQYVHGPLVVFTPLEQQINTLFYQGALGVVRLKRSALRRGSLKLPFSDMRFLHASEQMLCPDCGSGHMRRLYRRGLVQKVLMGLMGFYPWECPVCRLPYYSRKRNQRRGVAYSR